MFKRYPFIRQEGLKDCGAACCFMIIKYYGGYVSMSKLKEMLKTTRKGVTAFHITKTLNDLGFNSYGLKLDKLKPTKVPFIANVIIRNSYRHFIVVYEVTDSYVLIADPATKIKKLSLNEFYKIWTGINIVMYPIRPITNIKNKFDFKDIRRILIPNNKNLILIFILSIIMTISGIVSSFFFQSLIENMNSENNLKLMCYVFIILFILKIFSNFFRNKILIKYSNTINNDLTKNTFKQIIKLPYLYYHNHTVGEVTSKINDLASISSVMNKMLLVLFVDLPLTIFSGIILFLINKILFVITLFSVLFYIIIIILTHKNINASIENTLKNKTEVNSYMTETIGGFETIKGIGMEGKVIKKLNEKYDLFLKENIKLDNLINKQTLFKNLVNNFCIFLIMIVGVIMVKDGVISLPLFITYNILISLFLEPIRNIIDLDFEIKEAINILKRVLGLYEIKQEKINEDVSLIELSNVSFSFDDVNYILKDINLKIEKGEKILISGKSGSGKSTLLKLIKGYFTNYDGKVLINGNPLNKVNDSIAYISQKEKLFTGTIYDNITLKGNKDLNEIKEVCCISEIVNNLDLGYYTLIEEDGNNLSGGQMQRIALARALQNFSVLIIDEGFSGLDTNLERKIVKNLFEFYKDKTIIVISHRLDNLDLFDRFIKLEDGVITLDESKAKGEGNA